MQQTSFLQRLEEFMKKKSALSSDHSAGLIDEYKIEELYEEYNDLFKQKHIDDTFQRLQHETDVFERRKLLYLFSTLLGYRLEMLNAKLVEEAEEYEAKATVEFEGKTIPYRQVGVLISNEPDRKKRKLLHDTLKPHIKKLTAYEKKLLKKELALYKKYGFDYISFFQSVNEVNLQSLAELFRKFLVETEEKYTELMKEYMKDADVSYGKWESYDLSFVIRAKKFDAFFPKERALPILKETLKGMGFDLDKQTNIKVDVDEREKKVPRAYCATVSVPDDVRLVVKPIGGLEDFDSMLHEAGHAEHYAYTDISLPIEFKYLGDPAHSELYSYLFDHLTMNKAWLTRFTPMNEKETELYLRHMLTQTLFFIRKYFGKMLYELKFFGNDLRKLDERYLPLDNQQYKNFQECYEDLAYRTTKIHYPKDGYLISIDGGFYSAGYSRAWLAEAMVRRKLEKLFGENWFEKKETGEFLKKLYVNGDKIKIEDAVLLAGCGPLSIDALKQDFEQL